jgi:hypothetical protein
MATPRDPNGLGNDREAELRRREARLKERELELRLRELDAEINQPPLHQTVKHTPREPQSQPQVWMRKAKKIAIFCGIVVGVVVLMRLAAMLASFVIVAAMAFVIYKLFFDDRSTEK